MLLEAHCDQFYCFLLNIIELRIKYKFNGQYLNSPGSYMLIVNNRNTRTRCKICSKLTIKTPGQRQWRLSDVFIVTVNFKHTSHIALLFLLLTLSRQMLDEKCPHNG